MRINGEIYTFASGRRSNKERSCQSDIAVIHAWLHSVKTNDNEVTESYSD